MSKNAKKIILYIIIFIALIGITILLLWLINPNYIKNNILINKTIETQNKNTMLFDGTVSKIDTESIEVNVIDHSNNTSIPRKVKIDNHTKYFRELNETTDINLKDIKVGDFVKIETMISGDVDVPADTVYLVIQNILDGKIKEIKGNNLIITVNNNDIEIQTNEKTQYYKIKPSSRMQIQTNKSNNENALDKINLNNLAVNDKVIINLTEDQKINPKIADSVVVATEHK